MNLGQALESLEEHDSEWIIYVRADDPIDARTEVVVDACAGSGEPPSSAQGMEYLLEVVLARDVVRVWSQWRDGRVPTLEEKVAAIVYYAKHDAFLPVE
jgi:hypothetical protein